MCGNILFCAFLQLNVQRCTRCPSVTFARRIFSSAERSASPVHRFPAALSRSRNRMFTVSGLLSMERPEPCMSAPGASGPALLREPEQRCRPRRSRNGDPAVLQAEHLPAGRCSFFVQPQASGSASGTGSGDQAADCATRFFPWNSNGSGIRQANGGSALIFDKQTASGVIQIAI